MFEISVLLGASENPNHHTFACQVQTFRIDVLGTETGFAHKQQPLPLSGAQSMKHWHWPVVSAGTVNIVFSVDVSGRIKFYLLLGKE